MDKRGPRPQPTALKVARGNPGKRKTTAASRSRRATSAISPNGSTPAGGNAGSKSSRSSMRSAYSPASTARPSSPAATHGAATRPPSSSFASTQRSSRSATQGGLDGRVAVIARKVPPSGAGGDAEGSMTTDGVTCLSLGAWGPPILTSLTTPNTVHVQRDREFEQCCHRRMITRQKEHAPSRDRGGAQSADRLASH